MANTKQVHFDAFVPFDWASNLTPREAKCWAAWVLGPHGLPFKYESADTIENDRGGITTRYRLSIDGFEAIAESALAIMADSLRKQQYAEVVAESRDVDNDGPWYTVRTVKQQRAAERRASREMERRMQGHHWVTTEHGDGITSAELVPDDK